MTTLRSKLIRLANKNPQLRPHLLPLLNEGARYAAPSPRGEAQKALMEYLNSMEKGDFLLTDVAKRPSLRGIHFKGILSAAEALKKNGLVEFDGVSIRKIASRDPFWMVAKYPGKDAKGNPVRRGDRVFYYPSTKTMLTGEDAEKASREFDAARSDEDFYNMG